MVPQATTARKQQEAAAAGSRKTRQSNSTVTLPTVVPTTNTYSLGDAVITSTPEGGGGAGGGAVFEPNHITGSSDGCAFGDLTCPPAPLRKSLTHSQLIEIDENEEYRKNRIEDEPPQVETSASPISIFVNNEIVGDGKSKKRLSARKSNRTNANLEWMMRPSSEIENGRFNVIAAPGGAAALDGFATPVPIEKGLNAGFMQVILSSSPKDTADEGTAVQGGGRILSKNRRASSGSSSLSAGNKGTAAILQPKVKKRSTITNKEGGGGGGGGGADEPIRPDDSHHDETKVDAKSTKTDVAKRDINPTDMTKVGSFNEKKPIASKSSTNGESSSRDISSKEDTLNKRTSSLCRRSSRDCDNSETTAGVSTTMVGAVPRRELLRRRSSREDADSSRQESIKSKKPSMQRGSDQIKAVKGSSKPHRKSEDVITSTKSRKANDIDKKLKNRWDYKSVERDSMSSSSPSVRATTVTDKKCISNNVIEAPPAVMMRSEFFKASNGTTANDEIKSIKSGQDSSPAVRDRILKSADALRTSAMYRNEAIRKRRSRDTSVKGGKEDSSLGGRISKSGPRETLAADGERRTTADGERRTTADGERRTTGDGERRTTGDGERRTTGDGERRTTGDGERRTTGDGERRTTVPGSARVEDDDTNIIKKRVNHHSRAATVTTRDGTNKQQEKATMKVHPKSGEVKPGGKKRANDISRQTTSSSPSRRWMDAGVIEGGDSESPLWIPGRGAGGKEVEGASSSMSPVGGSSSSMSPSNNKYILTTSRDGGRISFGSMNLPQEGKSSTIEDENGLTSCEEVNSPRLDDIHRPSYRRILCEGGLIVSIFVLILSMVLAGWFITTSGGEGGERFELMNERSFLKFCATNPSSGGENVTEQCELRCPVHAICGDGKVIGCEAPYMLSASSSKMMSSRSKGDIHPDEIQDKVCVLSKQLVKQIKDIEKKTTSYIRRQSGHILCNKHKSGIPMSEVLEVVKSHAGKNDFLVDTIRLRILDSHYRMKKGLTFIHKDDNMSEPLIISLSPIVPIICSVRNWVSPILLPLFFCGTIGFVVNSLYQRRKRNQKILDTVMTIIRTQTTLHSTARIFMGPTAKGVFETLFKAVLEATDTNNTTLETRQVEWWRKFGFSSGSDFVDLFGGMTLEAVENWCEDLSRRSDGRVIKSYLRGKCSDDGSCQDYAIYFSRERIMTL